MKITIPDTFFSRTGKLTTPEGKSACGMLEKQGGHLVPFSKRTHVLIQGVGFSRKQEHAKAQGVPVIDEAQLIELVNKGTLKVEHVLEEAKGQQSFEELLGDARAAMEMAQKPRVWRAFHTLMDRCDPGLPFENLSTLDLRPVNHFGEFLDNQNEWQALNLEVLKIKLRTSYDDGITAYDSDRIEGLHAIPPTRTLWVEMDAVEEAATSPYQEHLEQMNFPTGLKHLILTGQHDCTAECKWLAQRHPNLQITIE